MVNFTIIGLTQTIAKINYSCTTEHAITQTKHRHYTLNSFAAGRENKITNTKMVEWNLLYEIPNSNWPIVPRALTCNSARKQTGSAKGRHCPMQCRQLRK